LVELSELHKKYRNGTYAIKNIDFIFDEGVLGLIGPNGAGKSTMIKILMGLLRPSKGDAILLGENAFSNPAILKKVGILHEKPAYPPDVTGREFLEFMAVFKDLEKSDVNEACNIMKITGYIDKKIGSYSAGMLQRFGIADAILGKPNLVILDEPTSNLDPLGRIDVLNIIGALHTEAISFIVSTHILSELGKVCTDALILNEGRVIAEGKIGDLGRINDDKSTCDLEMIFLHYLREDIE